LTLLQGLTLDGESFERVYYCTEEANTLLLLLLLQQLTFTSLARKEKITTTHFLYLQQQSR
jgi:hypothetical protein